MRACAIMLVGCSSVGSLEIDLALPAGALRPARGQTVTLVVAPNGGTPIESTSTMDDMTFSAGELVPANDVQLELRMQDVTDRLVGFGRAPKRVDIALDRDTKVTIPVRRPFVFASDGASIASYDASLDPSDPSFQGRLIGVPSPRQVVAVTDGLVVASDHALSIVDTSTNSTTGSIPIAGDISDIAPVPGARSVAVAHSNGLSLVDLDSGIVRDVAVPAIDRVTVGHAADGTLVAYGLAGRVAPPSGAYDTCSGTSSIITVDVTTGTAAAPVALPTGIADIAIAPNRPGLYAALPCEGKVAQFDGAALIDVVPLERAALIAVTRDRIWAVGVHPATAVCANASGNSVTCSASAVATCATPLPQQSYAYVTTGAYVIVASIVANGSSMTALALPPRTETMIGTDDPAHSHAQILNPLTAVPLDLVALPDGKNVALVMQSSYFISALSDSISGVILPCLIGTTSDWLVADVASSAITSRVRTRCNVTVGPNAGAIFPNWKCGDVPGAETPVGGEYDPIAVGAIYGAR